jgi:hypothetical protein
MAKQGYFGFKEKKAYLNESVSLFYHVSPYGENMGNNEST